MVESLAKFSPVIRDAVFKEANLPDGHKITSQMSLPTISRRQYNQGVAPSKGTTAQFTEPITMLNQQSVVDCELAKLNGNQAAYRLQQSMMTLQAMTIQAEACMLYDTPTGAAGEINGLLSRLDATTDPTVGKQIVKLGAGGAGTNTSMLLVGWGDQTVHGIFPKGDKGGLQHVDMGEQMTPDSGGTNRFRAYVDDWTWKLGVAVEDKRFVAAVRNIDMSSESGGSIASPVNDLLMAAVEAYNLIYQPAACKLVWYVSRALRSILHQQAINTVGRSTLTIEDVAGHPVTHLGGVPVMVSDSILNTEAAIS